MSDVPTSAPAGPPPSPAPPRPPLLLFALFVFALHILCQSVALRGLEMSGFYERRYGPGVVAAAKSHGDDPAAEEALRRLHLWAAVLAFPVWLGTVVVVAQWSPVVGPGEANLSLRGLRRNVLAGVRWAGFLTPLVLFFNITVVLWYRAVAGGGVDEHPFTELARRGLAPDEWAALVFAAVVAAPVFEEVLFRGILQASFTRSPAAGWFGMATAILFALADRQDALRKAWPAGGHELWLAAAPVLFVLVLVPHFAILLYRGRTPVPAGIFAASVLFAAAHTAAWPSPVALTVLALGLGALAQRTRSVVGPIVVHGLFNGVSCVLLALGVAD